MTDINNNNIPDHAESSFHTKSLIVGAIAGIFGGGMILSLTVFFVPSLAGLLAVFAGNVCKPIQQKLVRYETAWACIEGGAAINGTDISLCANKLENGK